MRRALTVLLLLAVIAAAAWTLWRWNAPAQGSADIWRVVPDQSAIIIEVPDALSTWDRFTHTSQLWNAFEELPEMAAIGRLLTEAAERTQNDAALRESMDGTPMLIVLMRGGGDRPGCLFAGTLATRDRSALGSFGALLGVDAATSASLLKGSTISARPDTSLPELSCAVRDGRWILASSPTMMEEALLQLERGTPITSDTVFARARATLGAGADVHLLFHTIRAQAFVRSGWPMNTNELDLPEGWAALDVRARADALLMSGLIVPAKEHPSLNSLRDQGTGPWNFSRLLPASVSSWDIMHITDAQRYLSDRNGHTADEDTLSAALFSWVHGAMGVASSAGSAPAHWALFQTDDPDLASTSLMALCSRSTAGRCDTLNHRGVRLTRLPDQQAHERILGPMFEPFVQPWWATLGDVVVFAPEPAPLQAAIDAWNDGNTLAEDQRTSTWFDRMSEEAGRTWWCDVARSPDPFKASTIIDTTASTLPRDRVRGTLGGLTVQLSPGQHGMTHLSIDLQHIAGETKSSDALWSIALGTPIERSPDIVRNHTNNTRELLVVAENRIHLISSTGKVLWTYALDGPILGPVAQVDRFKNGKLQLLFNTASRLYLIDRNGKDLVGFPVSLPEKASAPMSAFDYDNTKEYRVLIPTVESRILNYNLEGKPVDGWVPPRTPATTSTAVEHLRLKNKDHLIIVDDAGSVTVLDRKGAPRYTSSLTLGKGAHAIAISPELDIAGCRLLWNDSTGNALRGSLSGAIDTLARAEAGIAANARGLVMEDLDHDGTMDVVSHGSATPTMITAQPLRSAGSAMPAGGSKRYADLNLDGVMDMITVTPDGRIVAAKAP